MTNVNSRLLLLCEEALETKTLLAGNRDTKCPQPKKKNNKQTTKKNPTILVHSTLNLWAQCSQPLTDFNPTLKQCRGTALTNNEGKKSEGPKHVLKVNCWELFKEEKIVFNPQNNMRLGQSIKSGKLYQA